MLALHDQVLAVPAVAKINARVAASRETFKTHTEQLLQEIPAQQLEIMW